MPTNPNDLRRFPQKGILGGVSAGIAYHLKIKTWMVRLGWFLAIFILGFPLFVYIGFWIFMPRDEETPADYEEICT